MKQRDFKKTGVRIFSLGLKDGWEKEGKKNPTKLVYLTVDK